MSIKSVIKYGAAHEKYKGLGMKAYCSLDAVCSAFAFRANLMVHNIPVEMVFGVGALKSSDSLISSMFCCEHFCF